MLGIMAENNNIPQFVNSDSFMADKNYVQWLSVGLRSIQVKLIFCTRLVQNYKRWIMRQSQCQKSCFLCLGDIKRLLFLNAIR